MEKNISKIEIKVELDNNKVPETIRWTASDGNIDNQETKAAFLSVWDSKNKESLRIDLWTKDMPLDEMKLFFYLFWLLLVHLKFSQLHPDIANYLFHLCKIHDKPFLG